MKIFFKIKFNYHIPVIQWFPHLNGICVCVCVLHVHAQMKIRGQLKAVGYFLLPRGFQELNSYH